ncbi:VWA domain-containing protein [Pseudoxanthobacter sp.]|uniref:VWA domain-containing protein n=1 Tax=Pseudoxanthobacter sp. TaxID=1925742 RepID=UPI002FE3D11E
MTPDHLPQAVAAFHFLRPWWLLAIVPALALTLLALRRIRSGGSDWRRLVDAHLLRHLALPGETRGRRWPVVVALAGWVLAAVAIAGPTWEKLPTPALDRLDPTVIVLSLTQSMNATDQSPNRLMRARHKAEDILTRMKGGQVGLIIYADAPFVAAPLTEDTRVISQMMPELATDLMPVLNDRLDLALDRATALLKGAGALSGRIVVLTDSLGDKPQASLDAARSAAAAGYSVNVVGIGSPAGAPMVAFDGSPVKDESGNARLTRMDPERLNQLAEAGHGTFTPVTASDRDLEAVLPAGSASLSNPLKDSGLEADDWRDMGPWLLLIVLALAPLAFRRGFIAVLLLAGFLGAVQAPRPALAQDAAPDAAPAAAAPKAPPPPATFWQNLWQRPDQQGAEAFGKGDYDTAAARFQNPAWAASAAYKAGAYDEALGGFAAGRDADYNAGNALARTGKLEDAIAAYDKALAKNPANEDAKFNRDLVQKLLDQQKQQDQQDKQDQNDNKDQKNNKSDDKGGSGGGDQNDDKNQNDKDQKNNDQKDKGKSGKDQSDKNKDKKDQDQSGDSGKDQNQPPDDQGAGQDQKDQQDQTAGDNDKPDSQDQKSGGKDQNDSKKADNGAQDQAGKDNQPEDGSDSPAQKEPAQNPPDGQKAGQEPPQPPQQEGNAGQQQAGQEEGGGERPLGQQNPPPEPPPATPQQNALAGGPRSNATPGQAEGGNVATMTEEDQNREQMLRMIPDDPTGLLRARIRAHYSQLGVAQ